MAVARAVSFVLIPCKPSLVDLDAIESTVQIAGIADVPACVVLNGVDARSDLGRQAGIVIGHYGVASAPCHLGQRLVFVHAFNHGLVVLESEPRAASARAITALYEYLRNERLCNVRSKKDLADIFSEKKQRDRAALAVATRLAGAAVSEKLPPSRAGQRCLTGWFHPQTHLHFRMIAAKEDKTYQQVLGDALNLLFEKHGMPPIA